jgi:hypothetical protein
MIFCRELASQGDMTFCAWFGRIGAGKIESIVVDVSYYKYEFQSQDHSCM